MSPLQAVRLAIAAIFSNKLRSFLTMLGVIIGVFAVIALVSVGQGATSQVTNQIQSLGSNLITVMITGRGPATALDYKDAIELGNRQGVSSVAPLVSGRVKIKYGDKSYDTNLEGTNQDYAVVRGYEMQEGRFLTPADISNRQRVVILGTEVVKEIYGFIDPLGTTVSINGNNFTVVGVLAPKGSSMAGSDDDKAIAAATVAERILRNAGVRTIFIQASSPQEVNGVVAQLEAVLQRRFRDDRAYRVFNQTAMLDTVSQVTGTFTLMLGGIAGISLLVGGIGIMNIMLVSVTERTREIGIRKAIGAKKRDILSQFLVESMVLSGAGGIIGIALGILGSRLIATLAKMPTSISWPVGLLAFGFSLLVGVVFGLYPANRAAILNPIEALHYE